MNIPKNWGVPLLALVLGPALSAQAPESSHFGAQLWTASPTSDFRAMTTRTGMGAGLFIEKNATESSIIQTRVDFVRFSSISQKDIPAGAGTSPFIPANPLALSANSASIGVDIRQYIPVTTFRCLYALAGLSATRYEFRSQTLGTSIDANGLAIPGQVDTKVKTSTKCAIAIGLGYDFQENWGVSARYTRMPIDNLVLETLETGFSFRF